VHEVYELTFLQHLTALPGSFRRAVERRLHSRRKLAQE